MDIKNIQQPEVFTNVKAERANSAKVDDQATQSQAASAPRGDRVSVSEEGILRTEAYRTAMSTSDVRQDKVNAIKARIANGTYHIDSMNIAANMLQQEAALWS